MARLKEVYTDAREVAHLWAHQAQVHARSSGNGSFYYHGDTIYSYGSHFPIARLVHSKRKGKGVFLTYREYSPTTATHIAMVRNALPSDRQVIYCRNPLMSGTPEEHKENLKFFLRQIKESGELMARAIKHKDRHMYDINKWAGWANDYAAWFGLRWKLDGDLVEQAKKQQKRLDAKALSLAKQHLAKLEKQCAADIEAWKRGEISHIRNGTMLKQTYLRIDKGDPDTEGSEDIITTSQGAKFPLSHGLKALPLIKKCHDEKKEWHTNGKTIHLGSYKIDSIGADGMVHAGCHHVGFSEIQRIANQVLKKEKTDDK